MGKDGHHAVAVNPDGKRLHDAALVDTGTPAVAALQQLAKRGCGAGGARPAGLDRRAARRGRPSG
ncbi:hypothetical protein L083_7177 [Actinoplanes sp. N902-109]|nr:hypothetical protein L083_7177 [Actinoplanes sp. N902-109]